MLIAQITDLHVTLRDKPLQGIVDTAAYLEQAVAKLRAINPNPDVVLITGDLVDNAAAAEYQLLRSIIAPLTMPVYVIPGNHDDRDELRGAQQAAWDAARERFCWDIEKEEFLRVLLDC